MNPNSPNQTMHGITGERPTMTMIDHTSVDKIFKDAFVEFQPVRREGNHTDSQRKKGKPWTPDEHRLFLQGLKKFGKGDWRSISRELVKTRQPSQVASHAQKYFNRLKLKPKDRKRSSIHDMVLEVSPKRPDIPNTACPTDYSSSPQTCNIHADYSISPQISNIHSSVPQISSIQNVRSPVPQVPQVSSIQNVTSPAIYSSVPQMSNIHNVNSAPVPQISSIQNVTSPAVYSSFPQMSNIHNVNSAAVYSSFPQMSNIPADYSSSPQISNIRSSYPQISNIHNIMSSDVYPPFPQISNIPTTPNATTENAADCSTVPLMPNNHNLVSAVGSFPQCPSSHGCCEYCTYGFQSVRAGNLSRF